MANLDLLIPDYHWNTFPMHTEATQSFSNITLANYA